MVALNGFKVAVEEWTEGSYNCFICEYGAMMQLTFPLAQQPLRCFMGVKRTLIVNMSSSIVDSLPVGRSVFVVIVVGRATNLESVVELVVNKGNHYCATLT